MTTTGLARTEMPDELGPRRIGRRLLAMAVVVAALALLVASGPGLGTIRNRFAHASPGWVAAGVVLEALSGLSYVLIFRTVFCPRMSWRLSYQLGMAEQGANSVLLVNGAGGLALGAWALHRVGIATDFIARRSVAFFLLTTAANVGALVLFAALYTLGALGHDRNPLLTDVFGGLAIGAIGLTVGLALLSGARPTAADEAARVPRSAHSGRIARALPFVRDAVTHGARDGLTLAVRRPLGVLLGSLGFMAFDLTVLVVAFRAFGYSPPFGVLVLGYQLGQLGGEIPIPGGIGGLDAGLVGMFAAYHQPLATTAAAVLVYHAIALWVPALLGSVAFVQLRRVLARDPKPEAVCAPLSDALETIRKPRRPA